MRYIFLITWLIALDSISKLFALKFLKQELFIIPSLLSFHYVENTGIAFSIAITGIVLKIITLVLIFGIFWYYWKEEKGKKSFILDISYSFIFAGALWNAWERIFRWYVTDFISLEYFAVFNLADSYITLWACWILYYYSKNKN